MSNTNQEKIKQAVDLLVDKDTDLTSFFAKVPTYGKIIGRIFRVCQIFCVSMISPLEPLLARLST